MRSAIFAAAKKEKAKKIKKGLNLKCKPLIFAIAFRKRSKVALKNKEYASVAQLARVPQDCGIISGVKLN